MFELGRAVRLLIPLELVRIGGENVASATATLVVVAGGALGLGKLGDFLEHGGHPLLRHIALWLSALAVAWIQWWVARNLWMAGGAALAALLWTYWGGKLGGRRIELTDQELMAIELKQRPSKEEKLLFLKDTKRKLQTRLVQLYWWLLGVTLTFLLLLSFVLGRNEAVHQSTWYVLEVNGVEQVLLAIYGDIVVSAPLLGTTIQAEIRTQTLGSISSPFRARKLGKLNVAVPE